MTRISSSQTFDVTICGAGLAGLCLARQLKLNDPNLDIALLDKEQRPLDSGTHKVGESLIEVGANYLLNTLQLRDYLERVHNPKCALRFYTREGTLPLDQRTEFGTLDFPLIPAVQIDRGVFENDLRQMCIDMGVILAEGVSVQDVELASGGGLHQVTMEDELGQKSFVHSKWVVDALGRRRFLAQKLGLLQDVSHKASACWWRLPGRWEVSDAVAAGKESRGSTWRNREIGRRWFATNHLMGKGYWMWFIPVASHTSVGIVSDDRYHSIKERSTPEKAMEWMRRYEPHMAAWLEGSQPSDFLALKDFAYTSKQFYSADRWALVGEAAMFADPYYSTGSDLIALQNNVVSRMIVRDNSAGLTERHVSDYNGLVAEVFRGIHGLYDQQYSVFGNDYFQNLKVMWDFDFLLGAVGKLGFAPHVLDEVEKLPALTRMLKKWCDLNVSTQKVIRDWCEIAPHRTIERDEGERKGPPGLISPGLPVFQNFNDQLRMRDAEMLIADCEGSLLTYFQGRSVYLFQQALADLKATEKYPIHEKQIERAMTTQSINPYAIDLDPNTWEGNGLFRGTVPFVMDAVQMEYIVPFQPDREALLRMTQRPDEMFWMYVEQSPDDPAVIWGSAQLNYRQLGDKVASACKELEARGLTQGTVAAVGPAGIETLVTFLACLSSGAAFSAVPDTREAAAVIRDVAARLVVAPEVPLSSTTSIPVISYGELVRHEGLPAPRLAEKTPANRVRMGQLRYDEAENTPFIRPITAYSLTNLGVYQELALRRFLPILSSEAVYPKLRVLTTSHVGQDWLVPLMFGGTLSIATKGVSGSELVAESMTVAERLGGQPILSGVPNRLMEVGAELEARVPLTFFSIDKPLSSAQSARLSKVCLAVVDGGIVSWGHERHWTDEMKVKTGLLSASRASM